MRIAQIKIQNFRGIKSCDLLLPRYVVLIGDNNAGKSTILEAIDLCLGPDRIYRQPPVDEHDFHLGLYLPPAPAQVPDGQEVKGAAEVSAEADKLDTSIKPTILVEITITGLSDSQHDHFRSNIEWWDNSLNSLFVGEIDDLDNANVSPAIRVTFEGQYDYDEDDFIGRTIFTRSLQEAQVPETFSKKDKHICGFLYLRTLRTGTRALSLERGSLLDIILRLKEIRPQMWEDTIRSLRKVDVAADPNLGLSGILESINISLKKYVPREWGANPHLKVSNLSREHLRKIITSFVSTGEGEHAAPFYRQGAGTVNMLVLALLSQIAEDKQNVIFAMEEVETAIPPYAQKRIVNELRKLSAQSIVTSHSPYVLEEYEIAETLILSRSKDGLLSNSTVTLPEGLKLKRYRREFRQRFCEGLLAGRILVVEGATEASSYTSVARRLAELDPKTYASLESLGICVIDAGTDSQVAPLAKLYRELGKRTFGACDHQEETSRLAIEAQVEKLFMHSEHGFEALVMKNTTNDALVRFASIVEWPPHLLHKYGDPKANAVASLSEFFRGEKGGGSLSDFLAQCSIAEIPEFLRSACSELKSICDPIPKPAMNSQNAGGCHAP